jgi:hypothetical protein
MVCVVNKYLDLRKKGEYTRRTARSLDAAACIKERRDQVAQHAIFTSALQSALKLKAEFSKTHCTLMMC